MSANLWPNGRPDWCGKDDMAARKLDGNEWLVLRPMLSSIRLGVMNEENASIEHWCFSSAVTAVIAWLRYPDVPEVWSRWHRRDHSEVHP